jgi:methyltransferase (TIGR00027 family)
MDSRKSSRTAEYMAFFRALETLEPPSRRLFADPYAFPLLVDSLKLFARSARFPGMRALLRTTLEIGWPRTCSSGVVRTRAIDDLVNEAIDAGAEQLVLLGAGFDTRALRLKTAVRIDVFEVDHPVTQQAKRDRLQAILGQKPANLRFVPVDFEKDDLEAELIAHGFHPERTSVVVWEGVISYLTASAVNHNFELLARVLSPKSLVIFTYMHKGAIDGSKTFPEALRWRSWVGFKGEPFIFGFDPNTLDQSLRPFGFLLQSETSTHELARRYCPSLHRNESGSKAYRVAVAIRTDA